MPELSRIEEQLNQEKLIAQFDQWAQSYDQEVGAAADRFPFAGYAQVLLAVWEQARVTPGMTVLDLGVGTGNLARLFLEAGCQVLGVDFSTEMLARAGAKLPQLELTRADLTADEWLSALDRRFDRIVSNYLFHEFPLPTKIRILSRLAGDHLVQDGRLVIGDIIFPTAADLIATRAAHAADWDEEFYWTTEETRQALEPAGWKIEAKQISFCAGTYLFVPPLN